MVEPSPAFVHQARQAPVAERDPAHASQVSALPANRYFNREMSWLQFNRRVLAEARTPNYPPLEH